MTRIIELSTPEKAQEIHDKIWAVVKQRAVDAGAVIDENGFIVGRNNLTGEPAYDKQRTTKWGDITLSPDGTYYIPDLDNMTIAEFGVVTVVNLYLKRKNKPSSWDVSVTP